MRPANRLRRALPSPDTARRRRAEPSTPPIQIEPNFFPIFGNEQRDDDTPNGIYRAEWAAPPERETDRECGYFWVDLGGEG
jgi:hypothetical protein